jgi:hypothetical protein
MGTGMLATTGDTPKIANVSDAEESEQACRMIAPDSWTFAHPKVSSPSSVHERVDSSRIARLPATENLHCRRYAAGPQVAVLGARSHSTRIPINRPFSGDLIKDE